MTEKFVLTKMDAEPDQRTWSTGHFTVRTNNRDTAMFLFDYPECICKMNGTEAEALAAAKAFMAVDDLMEIAVTLSKMTWMDECEGLAPAALGDLIELANKALEKAGVA